MDRFTEKEALGKSSENKELKKESKRKEKLVYQLYFVTYQLVQNSDITQALYYAWRFYGSKIQIGFNISVGKIYIDQCLWYKAVEENAVV